MMNCEANGMVQTGQNMTPDRQTSRVHVARQRTTLHLHEAQHEKHLTHGNHTSHEKSDGQGRVEFSHNHGPSDTQAAEHESGP